MNEGDYKGGDKTCHGEQKHANFFTNAILNFVQIPVN